MTSNPTREFLEAKDARRFELYSDAGLVLQYGMAFDKVLPLPSGVRRRAQGQCYRNAYHLAGENPGKYFYCEGFASNYGKCCWGTHAWVVTKEGEVIDPTWSGGHHYYGIIFKYRFVMEAMFSAGGRFISTIESFYYPQNYHLLRKSSTELLQHLELQKELKHFLCRKVPNKKRDAKQH